MMVDVNAEDIVDTNALLGAWLIQNADGIRLKRDASVSQPVKLDTH